MTNLDTINANNAPQIIETPLQPKFKPKSLSNTGGGDGLCSINNKKSVHEQENGPSLNSKNSSHLALEQKNQCHEYIESDSDTLSNLSNASFSTDPPEDSFFIAFPGQTGNLSGTQYASNTQNETNLNSNFHISFHDSFKSTNDHFYQKTNEHSLNLDLNESFDRFSMSETIKNNEKLTEIISNLRNKLKKMYAENLELKKQLANQNCITSFEETNQLLRDKINKLEDEKIKTELEMEEVTTVFQDFETLLENTNRKLNFTEKLYNECRKKIEIDPSEMYQFHPNEVFVMYKKQNELFKKQSENVKVLIGEVESNKKLLKIQKNENEELKTKISKLIENDINKAILNFTIDENKKLNKKIEIQKERYIKYGYHFKIEMQKLEKFISENKKLKNKISDLEKNDKIAESIQWGEDFPEEGWETSSELECSFSEDSPAAEVNLNISENSKNISVIYLEKSNSLKNMNNSNLQLNNSISCKKKTNISNSPKKSNSAKNRKLNIKTNCTNFIPDEETNKSTVSLFQVEKNADVELKQKKSTASQTDESSGKSDTQSFNLKPKKICKFHLQKRCHFGNRCFNLHSIPDNATNLDHSMNLPTTHYQGKFKEITLQNRFQALNITDHNVGAPHMYWSLPPNPNSKRDIFNINEYPPLTN